MRSSPRLGIRRVTEKNGALSEPSTSRRTSRSETHSTPTPSETPTRPKRRRITDYMNKAPINAQSGTMEKTRELSGARLSTNGLNTPTEGSSPDTDGPLEPFRQDPAKEPELTSASSNLRVSNNPKYPRSNNPIAVAIWVIQNVQNAKTMVSPAATCAISSQQASGSSTPRSSDSSMYANRLRSKENGTIELAERRISQRLKQTGSFKS